MSQSLEPRQLTRTGKPHNVKTNSGSTHPGAEVMGRRQSRNLLYSWVKSDARRQATRQKSHSHFSRESQQEQRGAEMWILDIPRWQANSNNRQYSCGSVNPPQEIRWKGNSERGIIKRQNSKIQWCTDRSRAIRTDGVWLLHLSFYKRITQYLSALARCHE